MCFFAKGGVASAGVRSTAIFFFIVGESTQGLWPVDDASRRLRDARTSETFCVSAHPTSTHICAAAQCRAGGIAGLEAQQIRCLNHRTALHPIPMANSLA